MSGEGKRKPDSDADGQRKRQKYSKWKATNRGNDNSLSSSTTIENGTAGIWATCVRGLEGKATAQLREVLSECAEKLYPDVVASHRQKHQLNAAPAEAPDAETADADDLEAAIKAEINEAKDESKTPLFKTVRIDVACVLYFVVEPPMDPVALVERICQDAAAGKSEKRTRHVNRLTPTSLIGKATLEGIEQVAAKVLAPYFHDADAPNKSYAIRTSMRNHDALKSRQIIDKVASLVGDRHSVNLSSPDLVILVDVYRTKCGMGVVSGEYDRLKRFNLNEIYGSNRPTTDPSEPDPTKNAAADSGAARVST